MTLEVLFSGGPDRWADYRAPLALALAEAGVAANLSCTASDPAAVDVIVLAPDGTEDFTAYPRTRAVLSLWAGVERVVGNPTLTQPLCRMVDPAMTEGMVEYIVGHVLRHHLDLDLDIAGYGGEWRQRDVRLARDRQVAVLGLGELGRSAAQALVRLNFRVSGWSRRPRRIDGVHCRSGDAGLEETLRAAEIVVTMLPHTPETEGLIDAHRLGLLPQGAVLINPGRGALIDDAALIAALDGGRLGHATLDVFRTEPLPPDHPFWRHPRVTVTPHIASATRPETAARVIAENIRRLAAGEPLLHRVDRAAGY